MEELRCEIAIGAEPAARAADAAADAAGPSLLSPRKLNEVAGTGECARRPHLAAALSLLPLLSRPTVRLREPGNSK